MGYRRWQKVMSRLMAWMNLRVASSFMMCACSGGLLEVGGGLCGSEKASNDMRVQPRPWASPGAQAMVPRRPRPLTTVVPAPSRIFSRAERSCRPTWVTPMGQAALPTDTPM